MVGNAIINGNRSRGRVSTLTHRTDQGWFLSGLAPRTGKSVTWRAARELRANNKIEIPKEAKAGYNYMLGNNPSGRYMLSRNPQCSGGVGRKNFSFCKQF
jgi:hypothetical protein